MRKITALMLAMTVPAVQVAFAQTAPSPDQLPIGGQVTAGRALISQSGANMNIDQQSVRTAIDWQSFNIGRNAQVNFSQPSAGSVALNRVFSGDPSQIFGRLTANGQVFLTNTAGVYFAPSATVNVGGLLATTHGISNDDFMAGRYRFDRNGAAGSIINEGSITGGLSGYVALLAPEVRNAGVIVAQLGTVALAAGERYELQFSDDGGLADITVTKSDIAALVENKQAVRAPGGLIIMSAQAANHLQGGVVKNSGVIEASGMVDDGGTVRLVASDEIDLSGEVKADAARNSGGKGGKVTVISDLENADSSMAFSGIVSAQGGEKGGDGGFVETSGSHFLLKEPALVNTLAKSGRTGEWLIDPYNYTIDASAATALVTALSSSNVTVTTSSDVSSYGSNGNSGSTGNITVSSAINSNSANLLTLTAANTIGVSAAISTGALTLTGTNGITLNSDLTTRTDMTLNGNITLGADVTLTSGLSDTYTAYTTYTVAAGVTSVTATLVGGAGGKGGNDGGFQGGSAGTVGTLTASFAVTPGDTLYIAPGSGGSTGVSSAGSAAGGAGGTNQFNLASGGAGGTAGPAGSSGGGGGGGAATILALTGTPTTASGMLVAAGGGGGGGSGNNATCPGICGDQASANYRTDGSMTGQTGYNATNQTPATAGQDGGSSGGGGGGVAGGLSNISVFNTNEWTGRGGNVGSSGVANSFTTTSLSTSLVSGRSNGQAGYAIISYGGGTIDINGTINGAKALSILARSTNVDISGAIGGSTALTSFSVTGATGIGLSGGGVTTTGAQTYTGPLTLNANTATFTSSSNGNVTFAGDLAKGSGVTSNLTVTNGSGNVAFNGQTGTSSVPIGGISVTGTGTTTLAGPVYATSLTKAGSGTTAVSGGTVRTSGSQSYAGIFDISGSTTVSSTGSGNITFSGAVSNSAQSNLTVSAANGNVTLSGNLAVGTNARPTPIGDVSITASNGTVTLGSSGTPISGDAKSLTISSSDTNIYADGTTSFTCGTGSSAVGICLTNTASFTISSASTFSGPLAGTTSLTKLGSARLSMSGNNTYSGNTTVSAGILEISGSGKLGNGAYAGNISVTGQLRDNSSSNQTYSGTISGSGFINSPGSGTLNISTLSADHYNLATAYAVPTGSSGGSSSSSIYGDTPTFSYQLATTAGGGTAITDADPSGTVVLNGKPTATSNAGAYTISYASGLSLGSERYTLAAGNNLSWTVNPRPLTVTGSKVYDGSAAFTSGLSLSGTVNSDATPTLSGSASVSSANAGSYSSFAASTLSQNNTNYTLSGATISATITQKPLNVTVSKVYDATTSFSSGFSLSGMVSGESAPAVSGSATVASVNAGSYTSLASNGLTSGNANYKLTGGTFDFTITQKPLNLTVSKNYDGSTLFNKDFRLSGMAGGDPAPTVSGSASVINPASGDYASFSSSNLALGNSNYTLTGGTVLATILPEPPKIPVPPTVTTTAPDTILTVPELIIPEKSQPDLNASNTPAPLPVRDNTAPLIQSNDSAPAAPPKSDVGAQAKSEGGASAMAAPQASKQDAVVVSLVQQPSAQAGGVVNVQVPQTVITSTGGFIFALPQGIAASGSAVSVTKAGGEPLPSWIQFNAATNTFTATNVPAGGLPLHVVVTSGGAQTTIVISENH